MPVEFDLLGKSIVVPTLLNVDTLVDIVILAMHPVDREAVEMIVGMLDIEDATVVDNVTIPLDDCVFAFAHDSDVGVGTPREKAAFVLQPRKDVWPFAADDTQEPRFLLCRLDNKVVLTYARPLY